MVPPDTIVRDQDTVARVVRPPMEMANFRSREGAWTFMSEYTMPISSGMVGDLYDYAHPCRNRRNLERSRHGDLDPTRQHPAHVFQIQRGISW